MFLWFEMVLYDFSAEKKREKLFKKWQRIRKKLGCLEKVSSLARIELLMQGIVKIFLMNIFVLVIFLYV